MPRSARAFADAVFDAVAASIEDGQSLDQLRKSLDAIVAEQSAAPTPPGTFTKIDKQKRMVYGFANVFTKDGVPVIDTQGDIVDPDNFAEAVHDFMAGDRTLGLQHEEFDGIGEVRDSLILTKDVREAIERGGNCEGWWVGTYVKSDRTWAMVESGELTGYSIGGTGTRTEAAFKSAGATKDGLPASAFAYAPDKTDPSTWKLPYRTASGAVDPKHLAGAMAALSSGGFRGNRVSLPSGAIAGVKAKLRAAHTAGGGKGADLPEHMKA